MIKRIFIYIIIIITIALTVWSVGVLDAWVARNAPEAFALVFPLAVATILFAVGYAAFVKMTKVDKIKSEFITVAAHRLRTPLSRINWMLDELSTDIGMQEKDKLVVSMKEVLKGFTGAVNQLLDATEAGKKSLYYDYIFEEGKLNHIVQQVIADYTVGMMQKEIGVETDIQENLPLLHIDKERIKVAISIFVENAIMYTPKKGKIEVKLYKQESDIIFSIEDTGIGIPSESLPYIYTKFFRAKAAVTIDRDRTGLGLFIAKEIIKKHRGKVGVESSGVNRGSRFWFSVPIR